MGEGGRKGAGKDRPLSGKLGPEAPGGRKAPETVPLIRPRGGLGDQAHGEGRLDDLDGVQRGAFEQVGGTLTQVRRIDGAFHTKTIDPVGSPDWQTIDWNFHQVGHHSNLYDACLRLDQSDPRIPRNEAINGVYKNDLYDSGEWDPEAPFSYTSVQ